MTQIPVYEPSCRCMGQRLFDVIEAAHSSDVIGIDEAQFYPGQLPWTTHTGYDSDGPSRRGPRTAADGSAGVPCSVGAFGGGLSDGRVAGCDCCLTGVIWVRARTYARGSGGGGLVGAVQVGRWWPRHAEGVEMWG